MTEQWLSIAEYARHYDISDMTVRRRIKNGRLQAVLREGKYFIPVSSPTEDAFPQGIHEGQPYQEAPAQGGHLTLSARHSSRTPEQRQRVSFSENRARNNSPRNPGPSRPRQRWDEPYATERQPGSATGYRPGHQIIPALQPSAVLPQSPADKGPDLVRESRHMMKICEKMLARLEEAEKSLKDASKAREATLNEKIKTLEEQVISRDEKLKRLLQKTEDMQLLIKMLEKKELAS